MQQTMSCRFMVTRYAVAAAAALLSAVFFAPQPARAQGPSPYPVIVSPDAAANLSDDVLKFSQRVPDLSTFAQLLKTSGLLNELDRDSYTILAPSNSAWALVPQDRLAALMRPENREQLRELLRYHIIPGRQFRSDIAGTQDGVLVQTLHKGGGLVVHSRLGSGELAVNQANLLWSDREIKDDTVHLIDSVLIPSGAYAVALYGENHMITAGSAALPMETPVEAPAAKEP